MKILHGLSNKKGVFFTAVAILLAGIIVSSFSAQASYREKERMSVIETRVNTMNSFFKDVKKDLSRGLYISGYRSFLAMGEYINTYGNYIDDADARFSEAILNGTVKSVQIDVIRNQTILDWSRKIEAQANSIGLNVDISMINISVRHIDPWTVEVVSSVSIMANDTRETVSLSKVDTISSTISIVGLEDPLYIINSNGRVFNTIVQGNSSTFSNASRLIGHLNLSLYIASNSAPDFMMRLEGNLSNSSFGIESLVNVNEFAIQGLAVKQRSNVDYVYFGNQSLSICLVNETINDASFNWFRLDSGHLNVYSAECGG